MFFVLRASHSFFARSARCRLKSATARGAERGANGEAVKRRNSKEERNTVRDSDPAQAALPLSTSSAVEAGVGGR